MIGETPRSSSSLDPRMTQTIQYVNRCVESLPRPETYADPATLLYQLNWPKWQKSINFALACFYAMMVYAFVNATGVTWGPMGEELNFSFTLLTNTYAIGCATLALGAPMLIPFALKVITPNCPHSLIHHPDEPIMYTDLLIPTFCFEVWI